MKISSGIFYMKVIKIFEYVLDSGLIFKGAKQIRTKTDGIVLHHTGVTKDQTIQQIHNYHIGKGWIGIGYNFLVYKNGEVYKGRGLEYVGAHCKGYNTHTVGICAVGDFENELMTQEQKQSIVKLISDIFSQYPNKIEFIKGHKEFAATDCPGKNYPIDEIKVLKAETIEKRSTLSRGDRGSEVKLLQQLLIRKACDPGSIDGIFGVKTEKAVKEFQKKADITVDGIVGPITWSKL